MHLASMGHNVRIWSFDEEEARLINEERKCKFLPKIVIPSNIVCKTNFKEVIEGADFILHVTPSKFTRNIVKQYKEFVDCEKQPIVVCSKGIEKDTALTLDEVIKQEIPNVRVGALSGPSHAEEVSIAVPTVLVAASKDAEVRKLVQDTFMNEKMRIYTSEDIKGVELGGALKNIIAFCAGVAVSLDLGDNTFVTCLSEHSRNRKAGKLIGQGKTIEETKKEVGMTIESIDNIEVAKSLSQKLNISMPIVDAVYDILYNNLEPNEAVKMLMTRDKKMED